MKFHNSNVDVFFPKNNEQDIIDVDFLAIGAHQDDIEIMSFPPILEAYHSDKKFGAITCTDGAGSPSSGPYASYTREEMIECRKQEERNAAKLGDYAFLIQLGYTSREAMAKETNDFLSKDIEQVILKYRPKKIYTHNPFDKHKTHLAVYCATMKALHNISDQYKPAKVLGGECWRDLDWIPDGIKENASIGNDITLLEILLGTYQSQIASGKRYDKAAIARLQANSTYADPYSLDKSNYVSCFLDLTSVALKEISTKDYVDKILNNFSSEVRDNIVKMPW
ncbi:MAG: PIG-L deacetylase family protein [Bdellovibrionota bacterium]